jgi:hypothetical protein
MNEYKNLKVEIQIKLVIKKKHLFFCERLLIYFLKAELQKALTYAEEQMEHAKVIKIFHKSMKIFEILF